MTDSRAGKTIVLGVTGGIAAYKAADLASKLTQTGARVDVIMTQSAREFVTPLTFRNLTGRPVVTSMFELASEFSVEHVALAGAADVVLIAPATANTIARIAAGIADDMLTCTVLATEAPVVVAPAMDAVMYQNTVTQENLAKLRDRGFRIVDPEYGRLASGRMGMGRLADVHEVVGTVRQVLGRGGDLAGRHIVVSAGGTREAIDPVRYIGNRSSGKMGFALAEAARDRGADVTLVSAPTALPAPAGVEVVNVESVAEMMEAVAQAARPADALIMAAAPADYVARKTAEQKIKKGADSLAIELVRAPDIISEVTGSFIKVMFSAETQDLIANARKKMKGKDVDLAVANDVTAAGSGFGTDTNKVTLIGRDGKTKDLPLMTKREIADRVLNRVVEMLPAKCGPSSGGTQPPARTVTIRLQPAHIKGMFMRIPAAERSQFPGPGVDFTVIAEDGEEIVTGCTKPYFVGRHLRPWFRKYDPKPGDVATFTVIKPMKKYRLEILR